jgi:hypothetical protein
MREFNEIKLDALRFEDVAERLQINPGEIILESTACIPEADVLCCRYRGKRFNIKFDIDYGVSIQSLVDLSDDDFKRIAETLKR